MKFYFFIFLIISISLIVNAQNINSYVVDNANVFTPDQRISLEQKLKDIELQTNKVQFVVFTEKNVPDGTTLEERTLKLAEDNKIGKEGADNGILLYLATDDGVYRWEVGYGMEPTLSASLLSRISRNYMLGSFKQGNYGEGLIAGIDAASSVILNTSDSDIVKGSEKDEATNYVLYYFIGIILFMMIIKVIQYYANKDIPRRKDGSFIKKADNSIGTWGRGGFGGLGGFGGGGFGGGGFSGGGGSFGGGGFSGKF